MEKPSSSTSGKEGSKAVTDGKEGPLEVPRFTKALPTEKIPLIEEQVTPAHKEYNKEGDGWKNKSPVAKKSCSKGPISGKVKEKMCPKRFRLDTTANTNNSIKNQSKNVIAGAECRNDCDLIPKNRMAQYQSFTTIMNSEVPYMKTGWEKWDKKLEEQMQKESGKNNTSSKKLDRQSEECMPPKTTNIREKIEPNSIIVNRGLGKIKLEADYVPPEVVITENEVEPSEILEDAAMNNPEFETQTVPLKNSVPINDDDKEALEKVESLNKKVKSLEDDIQEFELEENSVGIFTQNFNYLGGILAILDNIKADGRTTVQTAKVNCVKLICNCIAALGSKVNMPGFEKGNSGNKEAVECNENPFEATAPMEMQNEVEVIDISDDADMNDLPCDTEAAIPENSISLSDDDTEDSVEIVEGVSEESNGLELQIEELDKILKTNLMKLKKKNIQKDARADYVRNAKEDCELMYNCIAKLESKIRLDILNIISFLSAKNIPTQLVLNVLQKLGKLSNVENEENIFDEVQHNSMIKYSRGKLSVDPIVQEVTRNALEKRGEFSLVLSGVAEILIGMFDRDEIDVKDVVHAQAVCDHLTKKKEMLKDHGGLFGRISGKLYNSKKYKETLDFGRKSEKVLDSVLERNSRSALDVKFWKGIALRYFGQNSESIKVLNDVYERQKATFGEDDYDFLETAAQLGMTYYKLKKYEHAMEIFEPALEKYEAINGDDHPSTLDLKRNVVDVLRSQNKLTKALKLSKEILEATERKFGGEHCNTQDAKHNVAYYEYLQYKFQPALQNFKELLEIQEKFVESNHPVPLITKSFIAEIYSHLGRHEESLQLAKEVHADQVQTLGKNHPDTIHTEEMIEDIEAGIAITMR